MLLRATMPRGKKTKKREPKRRQDAERQRDKGEDQSHSSVETTVNLAYLFKSDELHELCKILQKSDLADMPLLLGAVTLGKFEIVKRLLRDGHDIDCCGQDGSTPLICAAKSKNIEMIDLLVRRGANISLVDEKNNNALLIALQFPTWDQDTFLDFWNSVKDSEHLDLNHANKAGYTMLHYAVKNQWETLLESLLDGGVNVNCTTNKGVTPLMMAGSRNHCNIVKTLLRYNADISIEDERGCTALCYAIAFIIQKRLDTSHSSLESIISTMNENSSNITLEDYIKRRLHLLVKPPEMALNFADVISSVILSVIEFFLRFIQAGVELLLELQVFNKVTEATFQHMDDTDYIHAIIGVTFELVRYCDCCFGGGENTVSETELMDTFFDSGTADACLNVLKIHATTKSLNWLLAAALMPLFAACPSQGKGHTWLQSHYKEIQPFFHQYLEMQTVTYNFNADEYHVQLVKRKVKIFHGLMTKLENGEQIVIKKKALLKRGFGDSGSHHHHHSSNNKTAKSKSQEENILYKTPIGEKNFEDLTACLATCSKKMRRKVVKSLKMGNKLCGDDIAKFNSLLAGNSNVHAPVGTTSVPDLKNAPSTSKTDLDVTHIKSQNNIDPENCISSELLDTNGKKMENENINSVEKKVSTDEVENKLDYLKQHATTPSDTSQLLSKQNNDMTKTVEIFIPSGKRECQNMSDSDSNDEYELESQNDLSYASESKRSEISIQNQFSEAKLLKQKFKSHDNIAICMKESRNSTSTFLPNLNNTVIKEAHNEHQEDIKEDKMDYDSILSESESVKYNINEKDDISDENNLDFPTLEALYQEFLSKYVELWKKERENDYPGHRCKYNGNRYLCQTKDETLKKLKTILPKIERDYLQRLNSAWKSLVPHLQNTENKERFTSVAKRLKHNFLTLTFKAEMKLQKLRKYKSTHSSNTLRKSTDEPTYISYGFDSIFNRNNFHTEFNMQSEEKHSGNLSQADNVHFLQSVANLLQEDEDDVTVESTKIEENSCLYEECGFFSDSGSLDNATVCQKYDKSYASMSLKDCILAHINQVNTSYENIKTKHKEEQIPTDIKMNLESFKSNISKSYEECKTSKDITEFSPSQMFFIKNSDQDNGKNSAFNTMSSAVGDPDYLYSKNAKLKQVNLEDFVNEQRNCNFTSATNYPILEYSFQKNETQGEKTGMNTTHSNKSSGDNFSQSEAGFGSLHKTQQTNDSNLSGPSSIPPAAAFTVPASDRSPQTMKFSFDFNSLSRWRLLILSFQALSRCDRHRVDNGKLILSSEIKRNLYKISIGVNFGDIELGMSADGCPLAVKRSYQYASVCSPSLSMLLQTTITPLIGIRDEHILEYVQCILEKKEIFLTSPLCEFNLGEYIAYLKLYNKLESHTASLIRQFLEGLQFLHTYKDKPIVHGNLKPPNILIDQKGVVKLSDFGLTQALYRYTCPPVSAQLWWSRETYETYEQKCCMYCTLKSDIQVAGMLLHFILTGGLHPFGVHTKKILQNVAKGSPSLRTTGCEINDLISWMLVYEPQERPAIEDVFKHVYFWDLNKKWEFLLACTGLSPDYKILPICLSEFHNYLDAKAAVDHVKGDWVSIVKPTFPHMTPVDSHYSDTPTGLLKFIRACVEERYNSCNSKVSSLYQFFLSAFPALPLSLYRLIEDTAWIYHPALIHFSSSTENKHLSNQ